MCEVLDCDGVNARSEGGRGAVGPSLRGCFHGDDVSSAGLPLSPSHVSQCWVSRQDTIYLQTTTNLELIKILINLK